MRRTWAVMVAVSAAVGAYYLWDVRAAGYTFEWGRDLGGYYDYLGRAFAHGKLYVPIKPAPELLALPNPWQPGVGDSYKVFDMALYHGRYYLYHGAGPALLLFAPWRLVTGHDLPENFALFLLCFGGFLFSCGALLRLLDLAKARPGPLLLAMMLLALGTCQSVPYLLNRVWVYEIAIGGGYLCVSAAVFFLVRGIESRWGSYWFAASGLMFGLAIACRPHLGLVGLIALWVVGRKRVIPFAVPFVLMAAAVAGYNYLRFDNPLEFGLTYLLTGPDQNRITLATRNLLPGLYFNLFCPPDFSPVFPWVRLIFRHPFHSSFPPGYFIEPIAGALWLAPFVAGAVLAWPARRKAGGVPLLLLTAASAILLFLAATGFTTQRYEVDFLPLAVLAAVAGIGVYRRPWITAAFAVLILYSAAANLALGISGPYNEMLKNRPASYVRIARWFSPVERFRPALNPRLDLHFTVPSESVGGTLLAIGDRYSLSAERAGGKLRLISKSEGSTVEREVPQPGNQFGVTYSPDSRVLTVTVNGHPVLVHEIGTLVAAPAEIRVLSAAR